MGDIKILRDEGKTAQRDSSSPAEANLDRNGFLQKLSGIPLLK
jgi:hypothetical protein